MTEIVHDFSAYNRHVDAVAGGVGRQTGPQTDWWLIAKAVGLTLLAFGAATALIISSWRDPKLVIPEIKVNVEKPRIKQPIRHVSEARATEAHDEGKVVRNYVLFNKRDLTGVGAVVTGWKFVNEKDGYPVSEWCYLEPIHGGEVGLTPRIELPRGGKAIISAAVLSRHALTPSDLEQAQQACVWHP